jgi:hypothetical protein
MKTIFAGIMFILSFSSSFAVNELTVKDKTVFGAKTGYIEKATLVVEPFGSYVEQSLYLEYSERNQFTSEFLEIVHRFELPKDAAVNDMWLWIGDSIMQAIMLDTWTARAIYDSIAATKYDPAFLAKTGGQYELRVYPLAAGSRRKVKISFVVPTKWYGSQSTAELPLKMLLANNATVKPLEILFRTQADVWGEPSIAEAPQYNFSELIDTLAYNYVSLKIDDISNFTSLNLRFSTEFTNGYYLSGYQDKSMNTFFQLGISPKEFFNVSTDSSSKDVLVALDFSGSFKKNLSLELPKYKELIAGSLKANDYFKLFVSGNKQVAGLTESFLAATPENIDNVFTTFAESDLAKAIDLVYNTNILFCDWTASTNWEFTNLSQMANVRNFLYINDAVNYITQSDVVAAYRHGFEEPLNQETADLVIERLDSLFAGGGRFLTYYDYNREFSEKLGRHYIQGLKVKSKTNDAVTLYRNPEGNIGLGFPESFTRNACYFLYFTDPDVKVELKDAAGNPAVISKKVKNGLIVVTGMWSLRDDNALKTLLGAPLLGVNEGKNPYALDNLLDEIKNEYVRNEFDKVILLSDSDSLILKDDATSKAFQYINSYGGNFPKFLSVNLLGNEIFAPASVLEGGIEYYGTGYYMNKIADASNGVHLEKHIYDLNYISSVFSPYSIPLMKNLDITPVVDNGTGEVSELREINYMADPNKPRFFLGMSDAMNSIVFDISGEFEESDTVAAKQITFLVPHDTTTYNKIVASMLGNENIKDIFDVTPVDTAEVVRLSLQYNLLTDFSALLALEPNDTIHFLRDPLDEGGLTAIENIVEVMDSTVLSVYPNPFNSMATIRLFLKNNSNVSATIYNIMGQKVVDIANDNNIAGERKYVWNGRNGFGSTVSSGFYILRVIVTDTGTNKEDFYTLKLLHLK